LNVIDMQTVSWRRDDRWILQNIDWTVRRGEHWALIGSNGAGKTTLLNIINGYAWPTSGNVSVLGKKFGHCDVRELRKSIGWVSSALFDQYYRFRQNEPALNVVLSGKYASIGIYEHVSDKDREEAYALFEFFRCEELAHQPFHVLSQGEKQRVLLARAWMAKPELLILDEPCTGLDLLARERLLHAVQQLAEAPDGPTVLYVTHHVEEIIPLFTHAFLLQDGQVLASGKIESVLTDHLLSKLFGVTIHLTWQRGRPWVKLTD